MEAAHAPIGTGMDHEAEHAGSGATSRTEPLIRGDAGAGSSSSQVQGLNSVHGEEDSIVYERVKVVEAEENTARQAEQGTITSVNGFTDYVERKRYQGGHDVRLAMQMTDAVEDDAHAVAKSLTALLSSLKTALSEVTTSSVGHMRIENEAAGQLQDAAIDAASKGNRFINACLRLNEEMKGMERVASKLEALKVRVDQVESQASRYLSR